MSPKLELSGRRLKSSCGQAGTLGAATRVHVAKLELWAPSEEFMSPKLELRTPSEEFMSPKLELWAPSGEFMSLKLNSGRRQKSS